MLEQENEVILTYWKVLTDSQEYTLSEEEMKTFLEADARGARFVLFDGFMLNTAFVKEARRTRRSVDLRFSTIKGEEKYLTDYKRGALLDGARDRETTSTEVVE